MNRFLKYEETAVQLQDNKDDNNESYSTSPDINIAEELDKLFPPKIIQEDGVSKRLRISKTQATMFEIYELRDELDANVRQMDHEHSGFSTKMRDIYDQIFDELIRQEYVACPERGKLLVLVRDEAKNTMKSLQKLYKSCFVYAMTKDLMSRRSIVQKRKEIPKFMQEINQANENLQNIRDEWGKRKKTEEENERIKMIERTFMENQLIMANQQMVNQLVDVIDTEHRWLKDVE